MSHVEKYDASVKAGKTPIIFRSDAVMSDLNAELAVYERAVVELRELDSGTRHSGYVSARKAIIYESLAQSSARVEALRQEFSSVLIDRFMRG